MLFSDFRRKQAFLLQQTDFWQLVCKCYLIILKEALQMKDSFMNRSYLNLFYSIKTSLQMSCEYDKKIAKE